MPRRHLSYTNAPKWALLLCVALAGSLGAAGCTRTNDHVVGGGQPNSTAPPCVNNSDCQPGYHCVSGSPNFCAPDGAPPPQSCNSDSECSGKVCVANVCVTACTDNPSCGPGGQCVKGRCYVGGQSCGVANLIVCTGDDKCGAGKKCVSGTCRAQCSKASDCAIGQACDATGVCSLEQAPSPAQCTFDSQCGGLAGATFKCINATCHPKCASDDQCSYPNRCLGGVCRASYAPIK